MSLKHSPDSPLHEASLVDCSLHSPALLELLDLKITKLFIEYLVESTSETVDLALGRTHTRSSSGSSRSPRAEPSKKSHHQFVADIIHRAEIKIPVLLVALVYIDRARAHLEIAVDQYAFERVFLGGVILANKYTNDSTLKNVHWAMCSRIFRTRDIGRIEREFLDVLDFELAITEADILSHHASIMSLTHPQRASICPLHAVGLTAKRKHDRHSSQPQPQHQHHRRQASSESPGRPTSEGSTLVSSDPRTVVYQTDNDSRSISERSSSSSATSDVMDVDEPSSVPRKVTSFRAPPPPITTRSTASGELEVPHPQRTAVENQPPRVSHPPPQPPTLPSMRAEATHSLPGHPLARKLTPYVTSEAAAAAASSDSHNHHHRSSHRLSIPSALSIFKNLPIFHHHNHNSSHSHSHHHHHQHRDGSSSVSPTESEASSASSTSRSTSSTAMSSLGPDDDKVAEKRTGVTVAARSS